MKNNDLIVVKGLTKNFNGFTAVDNLSFKVKKGEIFGLLGPNGAGKTTTINMLSTLLNPSSGEARINNFDIYSSRDGVRRSIGIVFQNPALDNKLTGRENLEFHAMLYGLSKKNREKRIKEVLKLVDLTSKADILVEKYSGGMKRRLEIARGLIHKPKVLFLDEPTLGLDVQTRRKIWDYIKDLNKDDEMSIILTTHYMEEADYLCDWISIIDKGRIIVEGTSKQLKNLLKGDTVTLDVKNNIGVFLNECSKVKWISKSKRVNNKVVLTVKNGETRITKIIKLAEKSGTKVLSINLRKPSLEDVFIHFTGRMIRDKESDSNKPVPQMMKMRMHRYG